jgi:hypothetical protein
MLVNQSLTCEGAAVRARSCKLARRLKPGQYWEAEFALRWHNNMWQTPLFGQQLEHVPDLSARVRACV